MQLISCSVAVAGDDHSVVVREHDSAVTYPELLILKALHGAESVRHIADAGDVARDSAEERSRLVSIYGASIVAQVFPGEHTDLPEADRKLRAKAEPKAEPKPEPKAAEPEEDVFADSRRKK